MKYRRKSYRYIVKYANQTLFETDVLPLAIGRAEEVRGIVIDVYQRKVVYKWESEKTS